VRDFAGSGVAMLCEDNQDQRGKSVSERGSVSRSDKRRRERCVGKGGVGPGKSAQGGEATRALDKAWLDIAYADARK
jgi:hypothetical protein